MSSSSTGRNRGSMSTSLAAAREFTLSAHARILAARCRLILSRSLNSSGPASAAAERELLYSHEDLQLRPAIAGKVAEGSSAESEHSQNERKAGIGRPPLKSSTCGTSRRRCCATCSRPKANSGISVCTGTIAPQPVCSCSISTITCCRDLRPPLTVRSSATCSVFTKRPRRSLATSLRFPACRRSNDGCG